MKLAKTNKGLFLTWLSLGVIGYLLNYFVIKPIMYDWTISHSFSNDLLNNIYKLFIAEILLLPAIFVAITGVISSLKNKQFAWSVVHTTGLTVLILLASYSAVPIISPSRGI